MSEPRYLFLDLETTGLDTAVDEITEAAWILDDGTEHHFFVEHTRLPNEWVLKETDYLTRILPASKTSLYKVLFLLSRESDAERLVPTSYGTIKGIPQTTYLVGANPAFDDRFLRSALRRSNVTDGWGAQMTEMPYHYHLIDIEAVVMGALGLAIPPKLKECRSLLGLPGANEAPHSALSDAREVKFIWDTLRSRVEESVP